MTTRPGIRLAGGQAVHGVGLELGPPVADPAGSDDPAERLDQGGDHHAEGRLGRACPRPLVWARRWTSSARSTALRRAAGRTRSSASTRRAVERSTSSRCLTVGVDVDAGRDVKGERAGVVRQLGLLGLDVAQLAHQRGVAHERARAARRSGASAGRVPGSSSNGSDGGDVIGQRARRARAPPRSDRRPAPRCSTGRRAAPG